MEKESEKRFADYIGGLREKRGITMKQLCEGLCSDRNAMYIVRGEREPDRLMREALLERLGVGAEDYECYLGCEEYAQWKMQQQILHCITYEELEQAEELLERYYDSWCAEEKAFGTGKTDSEKKHPERKGGAGRAGKKLERQFYLSMMAQVRRYRGCTRKEEAALLIETLSLTVPAWAGKPVSELVLSIKELNLILEVEHSRRGGGISQAFGEECPKRYREMLQYIVSGKLDRRGMAKLYPKAVYFLCSCLMGKPGAESTDSEGLKKARELMRYCNRALKILRDNGRMYYLWEILDMRERLFDSMERAADKDSSEPLGNMEIFRRQRQKNAAWKQVLETVYEEFRVPKETLDYCYLYVSKGVSCTNEVIRVRSRMLGIKDEELCEGVCTVKTLQRIRKSVVSPQRYVAEGLFGKLGLSGELVRTELVTGVPEARELMEKLREHINKNQWKETEQLLKRIRELVSMDVICNKQVVQRFEILLSRNKGEIDVSEYCLKLRETLEMTLPYECFLEPGEKYLTNEEQACIHNMMLGMDKEKEEFRTCMQELESLYQHFIDNGELETVNGMYEFIMTYIKSSWGNMGEFDKADRHNLIIMKECLRTRRLWAIHDCLYDRWWNYTERKNKGIPTELVLNDEEELNKCILLAKLVQSHDVAFYQRKLQMRMKI